MQIRNGILMPWYLHTAEKFWDCDCSTQVQGENFDQERYARLFYIHRTVRKAWTRPQAVNTRRKELHMSDTRAVFRYDLQQGEPKVVMPYNARPLSACYSNRVLSVWALVNLSETHEVLWPFKVVTTGSTFDDYWDRWTFLSTATIDDSNNKTFVCHVFYQRPV